jgi:hypothetical protein
VGKNGYIPPKTSSGRGGRLPNVLALVPSTNRQAQRVISRIRIAVPHLARVVASIESLRTDEEVAPYMDLLERAMADLQITQDEADALRITAEQWGLRENRSSVHITSSCGRSLALPWPMAR